MKYVSNFERARANPPSGDGAVVVHGLLDEACARLRAAGCESPRLDAQLLLGEVLRVGRAALVANPRRPVDAPGRTRFGVLIARRAAGEPVAYILGRKGFRRIELQVDARVLVPRPETELLVDAALALPPNARVVDVGTGSGAVILALEHERPDIDAVGVDVCADALAVARVNARRLGLDVSLRRSDLLSEVAGPIDAVIANLPYVADHELTALPPDVGDHEPRLALAGGADGLDLIRGLVAQATRAPFIALEIGLGQAPAVRHLLASAGWRAPRTLRDLAGVERVVVGERA